MSAHGSRFNTVLVVIAAPLVVTVVGGLIVEWLKPVENRSAISAGGVAPRLGTTAVENSQPDRKAPAAKDGPTEKPSVMGRWRVAEKKLEFFPTGNLVVESDGKTMDFPFTTDEKNHIRIEKGDVTVTTVSLTPDELVLHWHEHFRMLPDTDFIERYKREEPAKPWSPAQVVMAVAGTLIAVVLVLACIGAATNKTNE